MTAFTLEALLLLFIMFVVGVVAGQMFRRARTRKLAQLQDDDLSFRSYSVEQASSPVSIEGARAASAKPSNEKYAVRDSNLAHKNRYDFPDKEMSSELLPQSEDSGGDQSHRPPVLPNPEGGKADDLKRLKGIGPGNEHKLNALGVFHFRQIAAWTPEQIAWVGRSISFPGRVERENWVGQAKSLIEKERSND